MKQLLLIGAFIVFAVSCDAQCVMYTCSNTGAMGGGFNDEDEKYSMEELGVIARKACERNGGTNCRLAYSSHEAGWWACMSGMSQKGRMVITVIRGKSSREAAIKEARNSFWGDGGSNYETGNVTSWYVYNNVR